MMKDLATYKDQMEATEDGYSCVLGYSTDKTVDLKLKDNNIINVDRDLFGKKCTYSFRKGNKVHFNKDMVFTHIEDIVQPKRYSWS